MQIVLWIIVSLAFLGSLAMFVPSLMSLGSPKSKDLKGIYYWNNFVSKTFCVLVMIYPILFLIAVMFYNFLNAPVLPWLVIYTIFLVGFFIGWNVLDKKVNGLIKKS